MTIEVCKKVKANILTSNFAILANWPMRNYFRRQHTPKAQKKLTLLINEEQTWSNDKRLIAWEVGPDEKIFGSRSRWSVLTSWPRAKYFPVRSSHSVNIKVEFFVRIWRTSSLGSLTDQNLCLPGYLVLVKRNESSVVSNKLTVEKVGIEVKKQ